MGMLDGGGYKNGRRGRQGGWAWARVGGGTEPWMEEEVGERFASLAAEVEAVLKQIREREARAEGLARQTYRPRAPQNIFVQLPGRTDFEYIKVPKKPPVLCFGSKTERKVFPDLPEIFKKGSAFRQEADIDKLSSFKPPRRNTSSSQENVEQKKVECNKSP